MPVELGPREGAAEAYAAELGDTVARRRPATAWAPTATPPRCSPATRCCTAQGIALARARLAQAAARARDADAWQAQRAARRILLLVTGADKAPMLARVLAGPDPERPRLAARPRAPGDHRRRRRAGDELTRRLARSATPRRSGRARGRHTGRTDIPLTGAGREARAQARGAPRRPRLRARAVQPARRARETAAARRPAATGRAARRPPRVGLRRLRGQHDARDPRDAPGWYLWRDGVPDGETPDRRRRARCDRIVAESARDRGRRRVVAHGHILRALGARWIEAPVALRRAPHLGTGASACSAGSATSRS